VARLAELGEGQDIVVSGCGRGVTTEWLATRTGAAVTGVDPDREEIDRAESRARETEQPLHLSYQQAPLDDLPYETDVFDAAIGEPELAASADPGRAVSELVRVTKPMGPVVLLQITWRTEMRNAVRELLTERLGLSPRLLVEWKQVMRDAGLVDIQVDDWTAECEDEHDDDCGPQLHWQDKMRIVGHAFRRSGWKEARQALARETELLRELTKDRSLGFSIIKGVKWPHAQPALSAGA
jgi:SAM-dependent methyltransferase